MMKKENNINNSKSMQYIKKNWMIIVAILFTILGIGVMAFFAIDGNGFNMGGDEIDH